LSAVVREAWAVAVERSRLVLLALRRLMVVVDVARSARTSARVVERAVLVDWARWDGVLVTVRGRLVTPAYILAED